jgi:hypothetical protein
MTLLHLFQKAKYYILQQYTARGFAETVDERDLTVLNRRNCVVRCKIILPLAPTSGILGGEQRGYIIFE